MKHLLWMACALFALFAAGVRADTADELEALRAQLDGLVELLVREGVVDADRAATLRASARTPQARATQPRTEPPPPAAPVPEWVDRFAISGDIRFRGQLDRFDAGNAPDRDRLRARLRLALSAKLSDTVQAGVRLATGNVSDIVSTNQTLETTTGRYDAAFDEAWLRFRSPHSPAEGRWTVTGGRMPNPWLGTDLVWDSDLRFEGVAGTYARDLTPDRRFFVTAGLFPLEEIRSSTDDKWLTGVQFGADLQLRQDLQAQLGIAYYDYRNIVGVRNEPGDNAFDFTAPAFRQRGNTLFDIRNDTDPDTELLALAADYEVLDFTAIVDLLRFDPTHVRIVASYARNIGYNSGAVFARTGAVLPERDDGFQLMLHVGALQVRRAGAWQLFGGYRRLERDAVLDAFTDSDFHLGGTNAKGFILGGDLGLSDRTSIRARWLSSEQIDGPADEIDTLQLDLLGRF